mmetsp:Transcript_29212/g.40726  ORF Transcript_29212/g.40726 Transcript_29212/m.40726 type:complete len:137 (-) Transcript_29212:60-470(-)
MPYHVERSERIAKMMIPVGKGPEQPGSETMLGAGETDGRMAEEIAAGIIETDEKKKGREGEEEKTVGTGDVVAMVVEGIIAETVIQGREGGTDETMIEIARIGGEGETGTEISFRFYHTNSNPSFDNILYCHRNIM